jgi:hypothetical protein
MALCKGIKREKGHGMKANENETLEKKISLEIKRIEPSRWMW